MATVSTAPPAPPAGRKIAFSYCTVLTVIVLAAFGVIRLITGSTANLNQVATKSPTTYPTTSKVSS